MRDWRGGITDGLRRLLSRFGGERRWMPDSGQRDRHEATVRERLGKEQPVPVSEAAERLGVSAQTVRRRVKSGKLRAEYDARGRISGVYPASEEHARNEDEPV